MQLSQKHLSHKQRKVINTTYCNNATPVSVLRNTERYTVVHQIYVTKFWENDPNRTSVKILIPPVDRYTTILLVQTLSITQTTEG